MKVLSSLYSVSSKTGSSIVWEFWETASGQICATNGYQFKPASNLADLRQMYAKFESYTTKNGSLRFSRTPLTSTVRAASDVSDPWVAA